MQVGRFVARFLLTGVLAIGLLLVYARFCKLQDPPRAGGDATAALTYTLTARGEARCRTLSAATSLLLTEDGSLLGKQEEPPCIRPEQIEVTGEDGSILLTDSTEEFRLTGQLLVQGRFGDHGFFLPNGKHLAVNDTVAVQINGLNATILVLCIRVF